MPYCHNRRQVRNLPLLTTTTLDTLTKVLYIINTYRIVNKRERERERERERRM